MPIIINGTTGISGVDGSSSAPAVKGSDSDTGLVFSAGQVTATLNGTTGNVPLVVGTSKSATGTAVDFPDIPSWAKKITIILQGVSVSSTNVARVRLGDSGGIETSGYLASGSTIGTSSSASTAYTDGFGIRGLTSTDTFSGHMVLTLISGSTWVASGCFGVESGAASTAFVGGSKTTSAALDRVQVTINGTDTFDAGTINIMYE